MASRIGEWQKVCDHAELALSSPSPNLTQSNPIPSKNIHLLFLNGSVPLR
jgi:hypothetical protein